MRPQSWKTGTRFSCSRTPRWATRAYRALRNRYLQYKDQKMFRLYAELYPADEGVRTGVVSLDQVVAEADRYREVLTVGRYHPDYAPRCYELEYMFSRLGDVEELEEHRSLIKELAALLGMGTKISTATEVLNNKPVFRWWFDLWREIDQDSRQFAA